jgi:enamine deaminase RidA (YjgF/YER057c/UK114 family)
MFARQHTQLDVEHFFLALLQQRDSRPAEMLARAGGDVSDITRQLNRGLDNTRSYKGGRGTASGYVTRRAARVLQGAAEEADRLNDEFISTEHLLLAITSEPDGNSARILREASIDRDKIDAVLREIRGEGRKGDEEPRGFEAGVQGRELQTINPSGLAKPRGFSHGVLATGGTMLFLAGQTALDSEGNLVAPGDLVGQYKQVLANLKDVVVAAGGEMRDIVKISIFVQDRDDYVAHLKPIGGVHRSFFETYYPAAALFEISRFFQDGVLVEIEGIAVIDRRD